MTSFAPRAFVLAGHFGGVLDLWEPVSDLVVGNNTINIVGGFTPVANVDLVIEGASA